MKTRAVGGALFVVIVSLQAFSQVGVWKNYTSMQDVRDVDRSGNILWAATSGGLFSWTMNDGNTFAKLTNADGLRSTDLTSVAIDKNGNVWTGAATGMIHVYFPATNTWRYVRDILDKTDQTNKRINSLAVFGDTLLVSSGFGLSVFRISQFQFGDTYTKFGTLTGGVSVLSAAMSGGKIYAVILSGTTTSRVASADLSNSNLLPPDAWTLSQFGGGALHKHLRVFNGTLFASANDGLFRLTGTTWALVDSFAGKNILSLTTSSQKLVAVTADSLAYSLSSQNEFARIGTKLPSTPTSATITASGEAIVGATGSGLLTFSGGTWTSHYPNGPNSNQFVSVAVDNKRNVWGASGTANGRGFYKFTGKDWLSFSRPSSKLPTNDYYRIGVGCDGTVWASSWGRGVVRMTEDATTVDTNRISGRNVGLAPAVLTDTNFIVIGPVVCDRAGNVWMSVHNATNQRVMAMRKPHANPDSGWGTLPVYVGSVNDPKAVYTTNADVSRPLAIDASDNLWIASVREGRKGLLSLNNRGSATDSVAETVVTSTHGLPDDNIRCIAIDRDNDIWVGTEKGIGIVLDANNPTRTGGIASYKPLSEYVINAIAVDPLNQKWVGTTKGAFLYSQDGTQPLAQLTVENTDGKLIDNEIKDIAIDPQTGTVYFGTLNGLASLTTSAVEPKLEFDELAVSPNPYRLPATVPLTIDGLVGGSKIKILTIDGRLIRELDTPGGRIGFWDGKDSNGNDVASGVYLVVAYSESQKDKVAKGKVAVLRR
ncbi:MAG: hypothetical protein HY961_04035 [Ignavibacteriae bacterium]|nr:hypothetical protein [Ignavibacteriota bacterium]